MIRISILSMFFCLLISGCSIQKEAPEIQSTSDQKPVTTQETTDAFNFSKVTEAPELQSTLPTPTTDGPVRVLFIGNSYTFYNDLPILFADLVSSGGYEVDVEMSAQGGASLADHASHMMTLRKLDRESWNYVVLQEQSRIPLNQEQREGVMHPAARVLDEKARAAGAKTILFSTWGLRDGLPNEGYPDYHSIQTALDDAYIETASHLAVQSVPVGRAWMTALNEDTELALWADDGSHPSLAGSYLAACVFYAHIFNQSPEGLAYPSDLTASVAQLLQKTAVYTVLGE